MPEKFSQESMQDLQSLINQAKRLDFAVYRELKQSQVLVEQGFYTEAALRLGRAIEAAIYSNARILEPKGLRTPELVKDLKNHKLYDDFKRQIDQLPNSEVKFDRNTIRARLAKERGQLSYLSNIRNKAAHPSFEGDEQEIDEKEYMKLIGKVCTVISTLFDIKLIFQSVKR
jgi:hypothetical protein